MEGAARFLPFCVGALSIAIVATTCGQGGQAQTRPAYLGGLVEATSNAGRTVTVLSLDRPVGGERDGLVEYAFIIIAPMDPMPDSAEEARIRWAATSWNSGFVEVCLASGAAWLFVAGDHDPETCSDMAPTSVRRVRARSIMPLRAAGDGASDLGTPGNGTRSHDDLATEWFQRLFDYDGLR